MTNTRHIVVHVDVTLPIGIEQLDASTLHDVQRFGIEQRTAFSEDRVPFSQ